VSLPPRISHKQVTRSVVKAEAKKEREAKGHCKLVGILYCCATMKPGPSDVHHLMDAGDRGLSYKAAGRYTIPLCREVHSEITDKPYPEEWLLQKYGVLARELADALWAASPDPVAMQRVVLRAYQDAQRRKNG